MRVGRPTAGEMAFDPANVVGRAQAEVAREAERAGHADRHALAVDQHRAVVMGEALERVAEGVAEVEQRALALLGLVGGDDARLGGAARRDRLAAAPARRRTPRASRVSSQAKKSRSPIRPYLATSA